MKLKINLQKIIAPSIFFTMFTFIVSVAAWIFIYYIHPETHSMKGYVEGFAESILPSNTLLAHITTLVLAIVIALLITQLNNKYAYISTRSFLHTLLFLLFSVSFINTHGCYLYYFATLLVLFSIYLFFDNYGNNKGTEIAFLGFMFLGASVFIVPEFILIIPLFWIGFYQIRALSPRTLFASILGFLIPWLAVYIFIYFTTGQLNYYPDFLSIFYHFSIIQFKNIQLLVYAVFILFVIFFIIANIASRTNRESIKTRKMMFFFQTIGFGLMLLIILFSENFRRYLPLAVALFSITASYVFTFQRKLFYSILFITMCVATVIFAVLQLIY